MADPYGVEAINPQAIKPSFGSYLSGILPPDIATACGAFSASMLQVRNIQNVPLPQLAQCVINLETMRDLAINGTSVPTNLGLATVGHAVLANGCGPKGTYTASDFFGCLSGIPYNSQLGQCINMLQDPVLRNIYRDMYLAVTWRPATLTATTSLTAVPDGAGGFDYFYTITGLTVSDGGGGYSRIGAPPPLITLGDGGTATVTGWPTTTNDGNPLLFGVIDGVQWLGGGTPTLYGNGVDPVPPQPPATIATIQCPPTSSPPPIGPTSPSGGTNTPAGTTGWPGMNAVVQSHIDQANARIAAIASANPTTAAMLNKLWDEIGTQLLREQRARHTAFYPLPSPKSLSQPISLSPSTQIAWIDAVPMWAQSTEPHMYAQTIEAICDWGSIAGQSIVGLMRQERNTQRLLQSGIPLDNTIPVTDQTINQSELKVLIGNGGPTPAQLQITPDVVTQPLGYYDEPTDEYVITDTIYGNAPVDTGRPMIPGSFAGSEYLDLIPPNLNTLLTSKTLTPATYTVPEAVTEVEKCNCECWDQ